MKSLDYSSSTNDPGQVTTTSIQSLAHKIMFTQIFCDDKSLRRIHSKSRPIPWQLHNRRPCLYCADLAATAAAAAVAEYQLICRQWQPMPGDHTQRVKYGEEVAGRLATETRTSWSRRTALHARLHVLEAYRFNTRAPTSSC